jgi:hypothetical protein
MISSLSHSFKNLATLYFFSLFKENQNSLTQLKIIANCYDSLVSHSFFQGVDVFFLENT